MSMLYRYQVYCQTCAAVKITDGYYEEPITACPVNSEHTIVAETIATYGKGISNEILTVEAKKPLPTGSSVKVHTPDFGNRTTWYQNSVLVEDEVLDTSDNTVYTADHQNIINTNHPHMVSRCKKLMKADGSFSNRWDYFPVVKKNASVITEGFTIDYAAGTVTFSTANDPGDVVQLTYYYENGSKFIIKPIAGKNIFLEEARVLITDVADFQNCLRFDLFAGGSNYPTGDGTSPYNQFVFRYRSPVDFAVNSDKISKHDLSCLTYAFKEFIFNYTSLIALYSAYNMELHISLEDDVNPPPLEIAIATFSMEECDV